jgi:hypothetical protein
MKANKGAAYILVLGITAAVMALLLATLAVVHTSRDVSARYAHVAGLFDMAAAGNEMALEVIRQNPNTDLFLANLNNFFWQASVHTGAETLHFNMDTRITAAAAPYAYTVVTAARCTRPFCLPVPFPCDSPRIRVQSRIVRLDENTVKMVQLQRLSE